MRLRTVRRVGAVLVLTVLTAAACGDDGEAPEESVEDTTEAPTSTTSPSGLPAVEDIEAAGALAIDSSPFPDWVTVAGDSAWVAGAEGGVARYDLETGELTGSVPVAGEICLAMDEGFDSLWLGDCDSTTIVRVDVSTGEVAATIALPFGALPNESSVAVDESGVWALSSGTEPVLAHIDPATDEVTRTFPAPAEATAVRASFGSLWLTRARTGQLVRVDPATGDEQAVIDVAPESIFLAVGEGGVWTIGSETAEVAHVDPDTDTVVATIPVGDGAVRGGDIAVGGGYVWARVSDALVAQIDPATDTVIARYGPPVGSGSVDADDGSLWVSAHDVETVWRLPLS